MVVDFRGACENPGAGSHFGIRAIPTLIFNGAARTKLARREGHMAKAGFLATLDRLGIHVEPATGAAPRGEGT